MPQSSICLGYARFVVTGRPNIQVTYLTRLESERFPLLHKRFLRLPKLLLPTLLTTLETYKCRRHFKRQCNRRIYSNKYLAIPPNVCDNQSSNCNSHASQQQGTHWRAYWKESCQKFWSMKQKTRHWGTEKASWFAHITTFLLAEKCSARSPSHVNSLIAQKTYKKCRNQSVVGVLQNPYHKHPKMIPKLRQISAHTESDMGSRLNSKEPTENYS